MKKSLTILAAACLFSVTGAFAQEAAKTKKCPEGAMLMAGYMCQKDKPASGCSHEEGFYEHKSVHPKKCFSCQNGTKWIQAEFACSKKG